MSLSLCPNLLFDYDGTLVDSGPLHDLAYRLALQQHLPRLLLQYSYDSVKGKPTRDAFAELGVHEPDQLEPLTLAKQRVYRELTRQRGIALMPGARQLLDALSASGATMFLVSSGSRGSIMKSLQSVGITQRFKGMVTAEDVRVGKPAPEPYLCCLQRFGLNAHACVAVEDAITGVLSARRAGMPVIGVHDSGLGLWVDKFFSSLWDFERWVKVKGGDGAVTP